MGYGRRGVEVSCLIASLRSRATLSAVPACRYGYSVTIASSKGATVTSMSARRAEKRGDRSQCFHSSHVHGSSPPPPNLCHRCWHLRTGQCTEKCTQYYDIQSRCIWGIIDAKPNQTPSRIILIISSSRHRAPPLSYEATLLYFSPALRKSSSCALISSSLLIPLCSIFVCFRSRDYTWISIPSILLPPLRS